MSVHLGNMPPGLPRGDLEDCGAFGVWWYTQTLRGGKRREVKQWAWALRDGAAWRTSSPAGSGFETREDAVRDGNAQTRPGAVTAKTITAEHVQTVRAFLIATPRKTAGQRALIRDCNAALSTGATIALDIIAREHNRLVPIRPTEITLDAGLVAAIESYVDTDWKACDPSKLGALNASSYIGERVTAIYLAKKRGS